MAWDGLKCALPKRRDVLEKAVVVLSIACLSQRHQHGTLAIAICGIGICHLFPPRRVGERRGCLSAISRAQSAHASQKIAETTLHS